jgi:uncharacterized membrane protein YhhN
MPDSCDFSTELPVKMGFSVRHYLIIVLVMSFSALTRIAKSNSYLYWLPFIGSLFFIASDTCLAFNVFKYNGQMQYGDFLTTITYLPAQFLIVFGLTYASPKQAP